MSNYKEGEHAVLVFAEAAEVGKLRREIEDRNRQLQTLVNGLTAENLELKSEVARIKLEASEKEERLRKVEAEITKVQRALEKIINKPQET